jgi:uncharacterized membrane protein YczE
MNRMPVSEVLKRYLSLLAGLILSAAGIALVTKAGLGTSPISSLPYVLSFIGRLSFGEWTFIINMCMMVGQIAILRSSFPFMQLLQIPMTVIFSFVIDLVMFLCASFAPDHYTSRIALLLAGCIILGAGIALQITANVVMLSGEGLVRAIASVLKKNFGTVKTVFDLSMVISAILVSLVLLGRIDGLREGTVISALIVGSIARFFIAKFSFLEKLYPAKREESASA